MYRPLAQLDPLVRGGGRVVAQLPCQGFCLSGRQRQEVPFGHRHDRCAVGAVIGLCGLRRDGQDHDAQRRERGNGERGFRPYRSDAASCRRR